MIVLVGCMALQVTEAQLAELFKDSGKVVDCRVCGDPNSAMRFAFIEFAEDDAVQRVRVRRALLHLSLCSPCSALLSAMEHADDVSHVNREGRWAQAIKLNGTALGLYPLRVMQSKTAIVPVNTEFLPRTQAWCPTLACACVAVAPRVLSACAGKAWSSIPPCAAPLGRVIVRAPAAHPCACCTVCRRSESCAPAQSTWPTLTRRWTRKTCACSSRLCAVSSSHSLPLCLVCWCPACGSRCCAQPRALDTGPVTKIRLLCDYNHVSSIAFVEFAKYDSAKAALDCSGALLGLLPIRVTPSKAPVRDES